MLTPDEKEIYQRQIQLPQIGESGQEKLKKARILLAGAGGLGSSIATYLTAAGIGLIRIIDQDEVSLSNLNRQIMHGINSVGQKKVHSAQKSLQAFNPYVKIEAVHCKITAENVHNLCSELHLLVDALDNNQTRCILNKVAIKNNLSMIHGAVYGFEGRATTIVPGQTACFQCRYKGEPVEAGSLPVIGAVPGIIGCIQAMEVIKYILGRGKLLSNRLLTYNGLDNQFLEFKLRRNPHCPICGETKGD